MLFPSITVAALGIHFLLLASHHAPEATHAEPMGDMDRRAFSHALIAAGGWRSVFEPPPEKAVINFQARYRNMSYISNDKSLKSANIKTADKRFWNPKISLKVSRPRSNWTSSPAYKNMRLRYYQTLYNSMRPGPKKFYMPGSAKHLRKIIKRLNRLGTPWVIRGGGHSYEANALPSKNNAAVIDMSRFLTIDIAHDAQSIVVGAGQRLGEVYLKLAQHNPPLMYVAGSGAGNGLSGYLTGAGNGISSRKYGWGSDQVHVCETNTLERKESCVSPYMVSLYCTDNIRSRRTG